FAAIFRVSEMKPVFKGPMLLSPVSTGAALNRISHRRIARWTLAPLLAAGLTAAPAAEAQSLAGEAGALISTFQRDLAQARDLAQRVAEAGAAADATRTRSLTAALDTVRAGDLLITAHYRDLEQQLRDRGVPAIVLERQHAIADSYAKTVERLRAAVDALDAAADGTMTADLAAAVVREIDALPSPA